ncbi:MAG TPA: hypothetical protein VGR84_19050, partial [Candidatus Acidoferrales bacterium]|nr:hypothetical protein [Candidatus Acidoferrales bacterium]
METGEFFIDPKVEEVMDKMLAGEKPQCELCGNPVVPFSSGGVFGEREATGAFLNCNLDDPSKPPCRHLICLLCMEGAGTGKDLSKVIHSNPL